MNNDKKILKLSLIENKNKKKMLRNKTIQEYKDKILNDLDDVVLLKFSELKKNNEYQQFDEIDIKNKFIQLYNAYIELNKILLTQSDTNRIIKEFVEELINNVVYRTESNFTKPILEKEILLLKNRIKEDLSQKNMIITLDDN